MSTPAPFEDLLRRAVLDALAESLSEEDRKRIIKEAIQEWLDAKFADVGKWSMIGIVAFALGVLTYYGLVMRGWKAP